MNLDDAPSLREGDPWGMLGAIERLSADCREGYELGVATQNLPSGDALSSAQSRSMQQAASDLSTDQAEVARLTADQRKLQAAFDATNSDNTGILIRLQALGRLSDTNSTLWFAHFMLSLLFICIELLPVFMKTLLNFGPATAYDKLAEIRDDGDISVETMQQQARREVERAQQELLVLAEKERVDRQKEAVLARRRARLQLAAEEQVLSTPEARQAVAEDDDPGRRSWDTGPIFEAARNVVRSLRPRSSDLVDAAS